nr:unnamed protein product [Digitaria exilis]
MEAAIPNPPNTRIAVVTGGNKGIGLEVCRQLASAGITVVLTARDETRGAAAVEKIREAGLSDIIFHQLEITDAPSIARLAEFLKARFGKLDILVNNAAVGAVEYGQDPADSSPTREEKFSGMDKRQRLEWLEKGVRETYDAAKEGVKTNYHGTKHLINNEELKQELNDVEKLTEERLDEVLDTFLSDFKAGEVEARGWPKYFSAYKVSKVTMNAYTRILARMHPELRVNCAHPGYVSTDMTIQSGILTPEEGGSRVVRVALLPEGGITGVILCGLTLVVKFTKRASSKGISASSILLLEFVVHRLMAAAISSPPSARVAVVTGGNKGIGLEVCRQLASNGITVVLTARDEARGAAAVEKLTESGLSHVIFHQLEVTDAQSIARLAGFLKERFGKLDILVLPAVQDVDSKTSDEMFSGMDARQRAEWMWANCRETCDAAKAGIQTNYYGTKNVTEALLPLLQASSDGRIVNVSSDFGLLSLFRNEQLKQELNDVEKLTEGRLDELLAMFLEDFEAGEAEARGWPMYFSAYKVAKAAMNAYSRILARKHPELRINCAHPGYVKTDLTLHSGLLTPEEGASNVVKVALLPEGAGPTGVFFALGLEAPFE